jgi:hypothetical protein
MPRMLHLHRSDRILHDVAMIIAVVGSLALCVQGYVWSRAAAQRAAERVNRALHINAPQYDARQIAEGNFALPERPSCPAALATPEEGG